MSTPSNTQFIQVIYTITAECPQLAAHSSFIHTIYLCWMSTPSSTQFIQVIHTITN